MGFGGFFQGVASMAWTYSGFRSEATDAARLTMARLFAQEISDKITADVSADGKSRASSPLNSLLASTEAYIDKLESSVGRGAPAISVADLRG
jgi:hypothetical protein